MRGNRRLLGRLVVLLALGAVALLAVERSRTVQVEPGSRASPPPEAPRQGATPLLHGNARPAPAVAAASEASPAPSTTGSRWLEVTVTTAEGAPIAGALVTVQMQVMGVTTDKAGFVRAGPLTREHAGAGVSAKGFVPEGFDVPATEGEGSTHKQYVVLQRAMSIVGHVKWADGSPAADVDVECQGTSQVKTDDAGQFSLEGLRPGEHAVRVGEDHGWRWGGVMGVQARVQAGTTDLVITLPDLPRAAVPEKPPAPMILVRVLDGSGKPVRRFSLTAYGADGEEHTSGSDGQAPIRARDLVWVAASHAWGESDTTDTDLVHLAPAVWHGPLAEDAPQIVLRLSPALSVSGSITDPHSKPVVGAKVVATHGAPSVVDGLREALEATSDEAGKFQIDGLPSGTCVLHVEPPPGCAALDQPVSVQAGQSDVALVLSRANTEANLTVLDPSGAPVPGANVRYWAEGGFALTERTDALGRLTLRGWAPGSLGELKISPPEDAQHRALIERVLPNWRPGDEVLRLETGLVTRGVVRDPQGNPVEGAFVEWRTADGSWDACSDAPDSGRFELPPQPEGTQVLRARTRGAMSLMMHKPRVPAVADHVGPAREVAAGASDVDLVIDAGPPLRIRFDGWPSISPTLDAELVAERPLPEESRAAFTSDRAAAPVSAQGTTEFVELDSEMTYSLWVGPLLDGRFVLARGLRGSPNLQTVALHPGLRTTVRPSGLAETTDVRVFAHVDQFTVTAEAQPNGSFVFRGLPSGTWAVEAATGYGSDDLAGEATVTAGGEAEIVLAPRTPPAKLDGGVPEK